MVVACLSSINLRSKAPSPACSRDANTISAPMESGNSNSLTAMSNDSVVTAITRSSLLKPGWRAIDSRKFTTDRCGTCTPFGLPVDPEV